MSFSHLNHLTQRLIVSFILTSILLISIYFSNEPSFRPVFLLLTGVLIGGAILEYYQIAAAKGFKPLKSIGLAGSIAFIISSYFAAQEGRHLMLPESTIGVVVMICFGYYFSKGTDPLANLAITLFGIVYLTVPLSFALRINYFFPAESALDGRLWLVYLLLVSKMTDTGGYFFGRIWGKHKLTPFISPNKTWEGAIGGVLVGTATSVALAWLFPSDNFGLHPTTSLWLGALLSIIAQYGDLAESLLKRDGNVKDSSTLPGLGGMLDITDSLVFTSPFLYIFLKLQGAS